MRRFKWISLFLAVLTVSVVATACRAIPAGPMYGITFDNDSGASVGVLNSQAALLAALPHTPSVRVVIDPHNSNNNYGTGDYVDAFTKFQPLAYTMAELVDSDSIKNTSLADYKGKTTAYVEALTSPDMNATDLVDIWEVGNEINGNWTGSYADVADKVTAAYDIVLAHNKRSAITFWENSWGSNHCGNGNAELTPTQFTDTYFTDEVMRSRIAYVNLSWYPADCTGKPNGNSNLIPAATIKAEVVALHDRFPNAKLGFGELGFKNPVTAGNLAAAKTIANYYYTLGDLGLDYYVGGYYWWYGAQDACCPHTDAGEAPMFGTLAGVM